MIREAQRRHQQLGSCLSIRRDRCQHVAFQSPQIQQLVRAIANLAPAYRLAQGRVGELESPGFGETLRKSRSHERTIQLVPVFMHARKRVPQQIDASRKVISQDREPTLPSDRGPLIGQETVLRRAG